MRKPRVLLVTPFLPAPPVDGGKKRVHTVLRLLADRYDVTLVSFVNGKDELFHVPSLLKFCKQVVPVELQAETPPAPDDFLLPQIAKSCYVPKMAAAVAALCRGPEAPDLVHFEFLQMMQYRKYVPRSIPVVFTEHDISNISFFRSYFREMTGWRRWGRLVEWMRLVKYQFDSVRGLDGVVTLTPHDTDKLHSFMPELKLGCVYTGVDLSHFKLRANASKPASPAEANLVYVGHYMHYPNEDAILYFCREIFPLIEKACPVARLWVVGSGPTKAVEALQENPRIKVTGTVKDVKPYLDMADVFVAPLRLGEGIKGKILEAWATGVPVVATTTAAWGLEGRNGEEFLVARTPAEFARQTVRLLFDEALRAKLVRNGRRMAEEKYDWRKLADKLDRFYREVLTARGGRPGDQPATADASASAAV